MLPPNSKCSRSSDCFYVLLLAEWMIMTKRGVLLWYRPDEGKRVRSDKVMNRAHIASEGKPFTQTNTHNIHPKPLNIIVHTHAQTHCRGEQLRQQLSEGKQTRAASRRDHRIYLNRRLCAWHWWFMLCSVVVDWQWECRFRLTNIEDNAIKLWKRIIYKYYYIHMKLYLLENLFFAYLPYIILY